MNVCMHCTGRMWCDLVAVTLVMLLVTPPTGSQVQEENRLKSVRIQIYRLIVKEKRVTKKETLM